MDNHRNNNSSINDNKVAQLEKTKQDTIQQIEQFLGAEAERGRSINGLTDREYY